MSFDLTAPEDPAITAGRIHDEARGCPCWRAEQQDPECPLHGKPEFRIGGEFGPEAERLISTTHGPGCAGCTSATEMAAQSAIRRGLETDTWTFHERPGLTHIATVRRTKTSPQDSSQRGDTTMRVTITIRDEDLEKAAYREQR